MRRLIALVPFGAAIGASQTAAPRWPRGFAGGVRGTGFFPWPQHPWSQEMRELLAEG